MKLYAMTSAQGTACAETVLTEDEYDATRRELFERIYCKGGVDDPIAGSWVEVTDNEACQLGE